MIYSHIQKYIDEHLEEDEGYFMEVLYFCMRRIFIKNDFSFKGIRTIEINKKFLKTPATINILHNFNDPKDSIAWLMSVRAIMLKPDLIDEVDDEDLFFTSGIDASPYAWVNYATILVDLEEDKDFFSLFLMLEELYYDECLSEKSKNFFKKNTKCPPFKNQFNYYKEEAETNTENTFNVIINNAYLGDKSLEHLVFPRAIEYVGNTAVSFCPNLQTITFERFNTKFGKFSIIECPKLKYIIVPPEGLEYYKERLPHYQDIIYSTEQIPLECVDAVSTSNLLHESILEQMSLSTLKEQLPNDASSITESHFTTTKEDVNESVSVEQPSDETDFSKIFNLFEHKSTTYKYFWFLAILDSIKKKGELSISFDEIAAKMIALAWQYAGDQINFGNIDKMHDIISDILILIPGAFSKNAQDIEKLILKHKKDKQLQKLLRHLTTNVPYRFLSPWIKFTNNHNVVKESQDLHCEAPYVIYPTCIVLDEDWYDYFTSHYQELCTFTKKELVNYLKAYNNDLALLKYITEFSESK